MNNPSSLLADFGMYGFNTDTYGLTVNKLAAHFKGMPQSEAALLASRLTSIINFKIANPFVDLELSTTGNIASDVLEIFPVSLMNLATLTLPWEAFRIGHGKEVGLKNIFESQAKLVCSIPVSMEDGMKLVCSDTGLWGGTLLDSLSILIDSTVDELIIINPYWSPNGIDALLRRVTRKKFRDVRIKVLTQPKEKFDSEAISSLINFVNHFENGGAYCEILSPDSRFFPVPLMHAKALVSDGKAAYLGSANFSGRGMDWSVELGVQILGLNALALRDWLFALSNQLKPWHK